MNKFPKLPVSGVMLAFASLGLATSAFADTRYEYADVIQSEPIYQTVEISEPHQECWNEDVQRRHRNSQSRTPALLGTIIGGAIGNSVGHGKSNRRIGTVVGAVLGHSIGRDIVAANSREDGVHYETVKHCETVFEYREEQRLVGYDVRYLYNNEEYSTRMDTDPGEQLRVRVKVQPVY